MSLASLSAGGALASPAQSSLAQSPPVRGPTVVSLDGCADQYVLGLMPREQILALSDRARLSDSSFRDRAAGVRRIKPLLETILALRPDAVVRTWGGDIRLIQALQARGIRTIQIHDVNTYDEAKSELYRVGGLLDEAAGAGMEAHRLADALADIVPFGKGRTVLYYTPSGTSAGPDTMTGDMLRRLGFRLESQNKGYPYYSPEVVLSLQPDVVALGFFDDAYSMRRVPGRHPLVRRMIEKRQHFTIPRRALACNGWFTAFDLAALSHEEAAKDSRKEAPR